MGNKPILTERDQELLSLIATCGAVTLQQAQQIYGTKYYHYKRIDLLEERGYIKKHGRYLELAQKGIDITGQPRYQFRQGYLRQVYSGMADLVMELTNWEIYSAREVRNKYSLNRANRFRGSVVRDGHEYAVYLVSSNPYARTLSAIQGEIKFLACSTPIRRAMVFAPNHDVLERFGLDDQEAEELLLLIYPDSLQLLNNYHSDEFQSYLQSLVAGFAPTDSPFADYEADDEYVADLILNDIVKINSLAAYFHLQHRKKVSIICLDSQKELMQSRFPSARQIIIPNKKGVDSFARRT